MDDLNLVDDIIENKNEPTSEEMDTFKNLVNDWFKYDDAIRKLKIAIRERKTLQQVLNNKIQDFMFKYNYNDLNTQNGRLKTNVKNVQKPVNIKEVREIINNNKNLTGEELLNMIFNSENRPVIVKKSIKRIIPKVSMSLDI
uniref:Uncharacterized protein n=1 Tax=viral metagenome TaxID=1070528 RepID=A0A6C0CH58_9ZZZZ